MNANLFIVSHFTESSFAFQLLKNVVVVVAYTILAWMVVKYIPIGELMNNKEL